MRYRLGRSFAASFASIALIAGILIGIYQGNLAESILMNCLLSMPIFIAVGWLVGRTADATVRESVEMNFRKKVDRMREKRLEREKGSPNQ